MLVQKPCSLMRATVLRKVQMATAQRPVTTAFHVSCQLPNSSSSARNLSNDSVPSSSGSSAFPQSPLAALTQRLPFFPRQQPRLVQAEANTGGTDGGSSSGGSGGGGGDGGGDGKGDEGKDDDDKILTLKDVQAIAREKNVTIPADMLETAGKFGLRASALNAYIAMQGIFFTGFILRTLPYFRDRILADPLFLFKVGAEVLIDSGCATVAEVRKRGEHFWKEFDFYVSDMIVGLVLDVVLVSLMAPAAVIGGVSKAAMATGVQKLLANVPSAMFEASIPGVKKYTIGARAACLLVKFLEYSLAGITCGFIGQGLANGIMSIKRQINGPSDDDVTPPPLVKTALVWGLFMGLSSNIRYQCVFGLERLVDMTIAKKVPQVAYATTVGIRFVNNVVGGENFIDMARWAGVQ